jgi:hypothetical protein
MHDIIFEPGTRKKLNGTAAVGNKDRTGHEYPQGPRQARKRCNLWYRDRAANQAARTHVKVKQWRIGRNQSAFSINLSRDSHLQLTKNWQPKQLAESEMSWDVVARMALYNLTWLRRD